MSARVREDASRNGCGESNGKQEGDRIRCGQRPHDRGGLTSAAATSWRSKSRKPRLRARNRERHRPLELRAVLSAADDPLPGPRGLRSRRESPQRHPGVVVALRDHALIPSETSRHASRRQGRAPLSRALREQLLAALDEERCADRAVEGDRAPQLDLALFPSASFDQLLRGAEPKPRFPGRAAAL